MASETLHINDAMPAFAKLPGVDGKQYADKDFSSEKVLVVVFSCNHCPYVQAYEDRMIGMQHEYGPKGVKLVAINSNETKNYPEDNFEEMVSRSAKRKFNFPYLRDETQTTATAFGATHTPEFFVFDQKRKLRYHGKMDDNYQNPSAVKETYLRDALEAVLSGKEVKTPETFSIGCTIKWK
jgi:thiol-disulfide isomerase/thioredoxin